MLLIFGLCQSLFAMNSNRVYFSTAIYDDDGRPDDSYEEKMIKLHGKKQLVMKAQVLDFLDQEIFDLKSSLGLKKGAMLGLGIIGALFYAPSALAMIPLGWQFAAYTDPVEQKIAKLEYSKREILRDLSAWECESLECEYIKRRPKICQAFRERIESLLIEDYQTGADHQALIRDLLFFPSRSECLSKNGHEDQFLEGLAQAQAQLAFYPSSDQFVLSDTLATLGEASFNNSRCAIYFETSNYDRTLSIFQHLAHILNRSYFAVFASKEPLSQEYLFGTQTQRGIVLEAFLAPTNSSCLNPLLIIIGIDEWMSEDNLSLLLPMLDPIPTNPMIQNSYFGLALDWSAMSILSCGANPPRYFPNAIRSRMQSYKF
jgi:hypothetical protein